MFSMNVITRIYVAFTIFNPIMCMWEPTKSIPEMMCRSLACQQRSKLYLSNVNLKIHPCDDFYEFACGNWAVSNPVSRHSLEFSVYNVLSKRAFEKIRSMIEYRKFPADDKMYQLIKMVYDTCMKIPHYGRMISADLAVSIRRIGRYPENRLWKLHNDYLRLTGESAFFDSTIVGSEIGAKHPLLLFTEASSAYGSIFHDVIWKPMEEKAYLEFLFTIMRNLNLGGTAKQIRKQMVNVLEFRKQFQKIIRNNRWRKYKYLKTCTPSMLQTYLHAGTDNYTQKLPWAQVAGIQLHSLPPEILQKSRVVNLRQVNYFVELIELLGVTPEDVLASHIEVHFVERHLKFTEEMYTLLEATAIEPHNQFQVIRIDGQERWEICLQNFNSPYIMGIAYMNNWPAPVNEQIVTYITRTVKNAMIKQMQISSWITKDVKSAIRLKLENLEEWIGFPPWYKNESLPLPESYSKYDVLAPNAYLSTVTNSMYISAAIMEPPVFFAKMPALYNYGGIGTTIGHELYHIIEDCEYMARKFYQSTIQQSVQTDDIIGLRKIALSMKTFRKRCNERKSCFVKHYDKLAAEDLNLRYGLENFTSDATKTFAEDFADVMGLQAAYEAYKTHIKHNQNACQSIPHFRKYTCDQMFFITYANIFCETESMKVAVSRLLTGPHSTGSIRVNGAVANNEDFARAFKCAENTRMNPSTKCSLWK